MDVSELKVQSEKTKDGTKWISYIKEIDGKEIPKVCLLPLLQGFQKTLVIFYCSQQGLLLFVTGTQSESQLSAVYRWP